MQIAIRRFFTGLWLACIAMSALALNPERQLAQYHHQTFAPRPDSVTAVTGVAQTEDGFLWVGTTSGLFRFDGVTFEAVTSLGGLSIRSLPVYLLMGEPGGGLWIGYGGGAGAGYYKDGKYSALGPENGWDYLVSAAVDRDGEVWAAVDRRLVRIQRMQRQVIGKDWGLPDGVVRDVVVDDAGTVWVTLVGHKDLMYLLRGETSFRWVGEHVGSVRLTAGRDNTLFASGPQGLRAVVKRAGQPIRVETISSRPIGKTLVDRDGGLLASTETGLVHIGNASRLLKAGGDRELMADRQLGTYGEALATGMAHSMIEDREGNVWVGSSVGLERFRDARFTLVRGPDTTFPYEIVAGAGNVVWICNWNSGLLRIEDRKRIVPVPGLGLHISGLYRDPAGSIWVPSTSGLWRSNGIGTFAPVSIPERMLQPWVSNMTMDKTGDIWIMASGLVRGSPDNSNWRYMTKGDGFDDRISGRAMMTDDSGRTWLSRGSDIIRTDGGPPYALPALSDKAKVGVIQSFSQRHDHVWIGGLDGLALVIGEEAINLRTSSGKSFNQVSAVVETSEGGLWVRGLDDVWHISAEELRRALRERSSTVDADHFDSLDGLPSTGLRTKTTVVQADDGTIWFGTRLGAAWIDPAVPVRSTPPPTLHVKSVTADGVAHAADQAVILPPLSQRVEVSYTAIELGYPERVEFRYKLEGFDREWQVAGTRRIAYYNDLPPGDYRFRLMSSDRNGRWHEETEGARTWSVRVTPAWFQATWFKAAAAGLVLVFFVLMYRLRIRQVTMRVRLQMREQIAERERIARARQDERDHIARDLHDTLIQSTQGLIYIFQGLVKRVAFDEATSTKLNYALTRANEVASEGRDMIKDLRLPMTFPHDLAGVFAEIGSEIDDELAARLHIEVSGIVRAVEAAPYDAICRIGREALINALHHANATSIKVHIAYQDEQLILSIVDNGSGISATIRDASSISGHWGIQGMRERAARMGAKLELLDGVHGGTEVRLTAPALTVYRDTPKRSSWNTSEEIADTPMYAVQ